MQILFYTVFHKNSNHPFAVLLYLQILVQHIKNVLPGLKSQINAELVTVAKEHAAFGEVAESKVLICIII